MQLAAVNDCRFASAVRHGVGHRTSAAAAISGQRQVFTVGCSGRGHGQRSLLGLGDGGPGDRQHLGVCQRIVAGSDGSRGKDNLICLVDIGAVVFQRAADGEGIAAHQRTVLYRNAKAAGRIGIGIVDLGNWAGMGQIIRRQRLGCDGEIRLAGVDLGGGLIRHGHGVVACVSGPLTQNRSIRFGIGDLCRHASGHSIHRRICSPAVGPVAHRNGDIVGRGLFLQSQRDHYRNNLVVSTGQIDIYGGC